MIIKPGEKHFTASVLLISQEKPKRVALVNHKKLDVWLQPGGHVEPFENPLEAAIREVREEIGLDIASLLKPRRKLSGSIFLPPPVYLMEQLIPAHGDQPTHYHLDNMYVVKVPPQELSHQVKEAHAADWFTLDKALQLPLFENTKFILTEILSDLHIQ